MSQKETYIGDGLYASFDGWMIKLRAPREDGDHVVYLEPDVYLALKRFGDKAFKIAQPTDDDNDRP